MAKLLLIEDDPVLGLGIKINLEYEHYAVQWAQSLAEARRLNGSEMFDLVILDLGLPDGDGIDFCTDVRSANSRMPIIILTAKTDEETVVKGLSIGANDYMRKPFGNKELLARIKNLLHEPSLREEQERFDELLILKQQRKIMFRGGEIHISRREYEILSYLVSHAETVVTREQLMNHIYSDQETVDRSIDSHLSHLRSKFKRAGLDTLRITSVYGVGYVLERNS